MAWGVERDSHKNKKKILPKKNSTLSQLTPVVNPPVSALKSRDMHARLTPRPKMPPPPSRPQHPKRPSLARNYWLVAWTLPVVFVLFYLPLLQEWEDRLKGQGRAPLQERVAILQQHPIDFAVRGSKHQRWYFPAAKAYATWHPGSTDGGSGLPLYPSQCVRIFGFNESLAKNPALRKALPKIKIIRVIGERNSGTRVLRADLAKALRNMTIENGLSRWGYWFQDPNVVSTNPATDFLPHETLVIHVVCEPYEWFARMQANPIHAPFHRRPHDVSNWTALSFFRLPWTLPRPEWDDESPASGHCQYRFPFGGVVPCLPGKYTGNKASTLYPVYEMNPSKAKPFSSIVHLRTAKVLNFLNVSEWMPHIVHVRSHDVASLDGFNSFVSALLDRYRLPLACKLFKRAPLQAQGNPISSSSTAAGTSGMASAISYQSWADAVAPPLSKAQERFVTCNLDWYLERDLGFFANEDPEVVCPNGPIGRSGPVDIRRVNHNNRNENLGERKASEVAGEQLPPVSRGKQDESALLPDEKRSVKGGLLLRIMDGFGGRV